MSTKTITMSVSNSDGGNINITQRFNDDCNWPAIAYQFSCLLRGMGYRLEPEDVGGDVGSFVSSTENLEETW